MGQQVRDMGLAARRAIAITPGDMATAEGICGVPWLSTKRIARRFSREVIITSDACTEYCQPTSSTHQSVRKEKDSLRIGITLKNVLTWTD